MTIETAPIVLRTTLVVYNADGLADSLWKRTGSTPTRTIYGPKGLGAPYQDSTGVVVIGVERGSAGIQRVAFQLNTGITLRELSAKTGMEINYMAQCLAEGVQTLWSGMDAVTRAQLEPRGSTVRFHDLNPYVIISLGRDRLEEKARIQSV